MAVSARISETSSKAKNRESASEEITGRLKFQLGLIVAVVAFLLYANTLQHRYVLDDYLFITGNSMTQAGIKAIPDIFRTGYVSTYEHGDAHNYRPLIKSIFALEWQVAPDNPSLCHWVNVLLFAFTCFLLFKMLGLYFSKNIPVAFIASLFFAAHPIHTEAVANIKSLDEILAMLFFLASAIGVYKYIIKKSKINLLFSAVFFFLSLLSKESAISFLGVIALMIFFFTEAKRSQFLISILTLCIVAGGYLALRKSILGNQMINYKIIENYLYGITDFITQKTTAVFLLGIYLKLLFFPHPLTSDGSLQQFPVVHFTDWQFMITVLIILLLIIAAVAGWKKKSIISFSILYFFLTASVVSNIFVLFGACYGERLMFSPSLGYCLFAASAIATLSGKRVILKTNATFPVFLQSHIKPFLIAFAIILVFSVKTISRNTVWHDDFKLYSTDVNSSPNSARSHFFLGNYILQDNFLSSVNDSSRRSGFVIQGISEIKKAIEIYPGYGEAHEKMAEIIKQAGMFTQAEPHFRKAIDCDSINPDYYNNYGRFLFDQRKYREAKGYFEKALKYDPDYLFALVNLATIYNIYGKQFMNRSLTSGNSLSGDSIASYHDSATKDFKIALSFLQRSIKVASGYYYSYALMSVVYKNMGDQKKSDFYSILSDNIRRRSENKFYSN